jgi:hypothetical protein
MKALLLLAVAAMPLIAQDAAPNVQLPQPPVDFRNFKWPGGPNPFVMASPVTVNRAAALQAQRELLLSKLKANLVAAGPRNCAIPLIQTTPKGNYPMNVVKPDDRDPKMSMKSVPAPACVTPGRP